MKIKYATPEHRQADAMLYEIRSVKLDLEAALREMNLEIEKIKERYREGIALCERVLSEKEKELAQLQKRRASVLYDDTDRVNLEYGSLLMQVQERVHQARGVLGRLEEIGRTEAVKVAKSVDWDKLKGWTDEELAAVGTRRDRKTVFAYELL